MTHRQIAFICTVATLLASGCVRKSSDGDTVLVTFAVWVGLSEILVGLAIAGLGFILPPPYGRQHRWKLAVAGAGVALVSFLSFYERVEVHDRYFLVRYWGTGRPVQQRVDFADLAAVRLTPAKEPAKTADDLPAFVARLKSGTEVRIPIKDLMEEGLPEILDACMRSGIQVTDLRSTSQVDQSQ